MSIAAPVQLGAPEPLAAAQAAYEAGELKLAEQWCRKALGAGDSDGEALHLLGRILHRTGQPRLAAAILKNAVALEPARALFHTSLSASLLVVGQHQEAMTHLGRAIELDPGASKPHRLLGTALNEQGRYADAVAELQRSIELRPDDVASWLQLGGALRNLGRRDEAADCYRRARAIDPRAAGAFVGLGNVQLDKGRANEAAESYRRAVDCGTDLPYGHSNLLFTLHYLPRVQRTALREEAEAWARRYARGSESAKHAYVHEADCGRPLRIGYVSADLMRHPVGYFLRAVLAARDRSRTHVICYSNTFRGDGLSQELRDLVDGWRIIAGVDDRAAAEAIRRDSIDILVDLSGHTGDHRLQLFALRPAPVQVTWLGYFGTTGVTAIDYILVDTVICPAGDEDQFSEEPVRLPDAYLCYSPPAEAGHVQPLPALRRGHITFGCFNRLAKITPDVIGVWSEIVRRVPRARLFLKGAGLEDEDVRERLCRAFARHGVPAERLELQGRSGLQDYLEAYGAVDVALDPFPFNGATTTMEALWMGVPVVTLRGDRFVARMGASLLTAAGLPKLVADSPASYVEVAAGLADDHTRLAELRARLRGQVAGSTVCNGSAFARHLEAAYRRMWQTWCDRQAGVAA